MITVRRSRSYSRAILAVALCFTSAATIAARPIAPGVTYRMRIVSTPPDMPGMPMSPSVIVGHGSTMGSLSRFDIDSVSGQMIPMTVGDYMLMLDSGRMVSITPSSKTYTEGNPVMNALPPEIMAQAQFSNVNVTTEKLGAGEVMQGFPTEKFRVTTTYVLSIMGQSLNTMTTSEMWVAQLPGTVTTAFDGTLPKSMSDGAWKELYDKTNASRKALGTGTSLKTVTTSQITGPMSVTTTNTVEMLDVKTGDIDPALFRIPEGFTKK